ncbi:MAG TPA: hypothetical protein VNJ10_01355 [Sphingomonas sp.]|nr:hypothetical protein [Sphingomonas sp.]
MPETIATNAIAAAVDLSLNIACEVSVSTNVSLAGRGKAAAARCIGGEGRLYRVAFDGWGPGFERMRTVFALVIDLRWDVDALVVSVLHQAAATIADQNRRRVRAAALGISAPMEPDAFADPRRLLIDAAAAQALRQCLGSDAAARAWTVHQLRKAARRHVHPAVRAAVRVDGPTLAIPFALGPLKLLSSMDDADRRVWWIDNEIRMPSFRRSDMCHAHSMATRMLIGTPLEGRLIVAGSAWSCEEAVSTDAHGRSGPLAPSGMAASGIGEWRFLLERRLVRFCDVFA